MFSSCKDIKFLEQLIDSDFTRCFFLMFADDPLFYTGKMESEIYEYFRSKKVINGVIKKHTGKKDSLINIKGNYQIIWKQIKDSLKFCFVEIGLSNSDS